MTACSALTPPIVPSSAITARRIAAVASPASRTRRSGLLCRASDQEEPDQPQASTSEALPPPRVRTSLPGDTPPPRPPLPQGMRLERVERLDNESWAGVAAVDRGEKDDPANWWRVVLLAGGDAAALLLFASIGRMGHAEGLSLAGVFSTAAPFLLGWFAVAPLLGGFGKPAQGGDVGAAVAAAAKSWIVAVPAGLLVRTIGKGYLPDKAFIIVSLAATAVLLVGWRAALAAATSHAVGVAAAAGQRKNSKGNPLEFLGLLMSLVKRW